MALQKSGLSVGDTHKEVVVGDTLTAKATVEALREEDGQSLVDLVLETTNQDGKVVIAGTATARIDSPWIKTG